MSQAQDLANLSQLFSSQAVPFRNRIINGDCRIVQRPPISCPPTVFGYGGPDRFQASNSASGTFTQQYKSDLPSSLGGLTQRAGLQQIVTAAASSAFVAGQYWSGIQQIIEGVNCFDLVGQPIAISFLFAASANGTYGFCFRDSSGSLTFPFTFQYVGNGSLQKVIAIVPPVPAGANIPNNQNVGVIFCIGAITGTQYQAPSAGAWVSGNYLQPPGVVNWSTAINNWIGMTDLQIEAGPAATVFERQDINTALLRCYRYFFSQNGSTVMQSSGTGLFTMPLTFPVTMRVAPTVTPSAPTYSNASNLTVNSVLPNAWMAQLSSLAAGGYAIFSWTAGAEF
jgi:hypothetical protein